MNATYNKAVAMQQFVLGLHEQRKISDAEAWTRLAEISPGRLKPVVVVRANRSLHDCMAAFLIDTTAAGGHRLLLKDDQWRIIWVRSSAQVVEVPPKKNKVHADCVRLQNEIIARLRKLDVPCLTSTEKGSRAPKSKKRAARSS